jgi:hypothetical protein
MILKASQGRLGQRMGPGKQLLLITVGRKSGEPRAEVMVGGKTVPVVALELDEPERSLVYQRFIDDIHGSYREYQARTSRRIPVVALEPRET